MGKKTPEAKATVTNAATPSVISVIGSRHAVWILGAVLLGVWLGYEMGKRSCTVSEPSSSASSPSSSAVASLTGSNFQEHLRKHPHTLVKFYAPWCGHCKKLAPGYASAALALRSKGVALAKVDATEEADLAAKYGVENYPTLLWFENGVKSDYAGEQPASEQSIVEWVTLMTKPAVVEAKKAPAPGKLPQVVLYKDAMTEAFQKAAAASRLKADWYFVKDPSQARMVLQHKGEEAFELQEFLEDSDVIDDFFSKHSVPLVGELNGDTFARYTDKALIWSLFPAEGGMASVLSTYRPMMTELAKSIAGRYCVTYTDTAKFKEQLKDMLGLSEFPAIVLQPSAGSKKKYVHRGAMTAPAILQFIDDVEAGKVAPTLKSEPLPASNKGPVRVVVTDSLSEEVFLENNKDVFLEIYAPWCGSCKKLEPEYTKLAKYVKSRQLTDIVTVAKIDGTANDLPPDTLSYESFPTLYFISNGGTPEKYAGERNAEAMWKWIKLNSPRSDEIEARLAAKTSSVEEL